MKGFKAMTPEVGRLVTVEMKRRRTGPSLWAEAHGFSRRTVNQVLHHGLGSKRGGASTQKIIEHLIADGYIDKNHQLVEQVS